MFARTILLVGFALWMTSFHLSAVAQERYELSAPQIGAASHAVITDRALQVAGGDGRVTNYVREPRFDSTGGEWLGYYSREANQILRWPAINSGSMQIGEVNGNSIQYRYSQMSIRALGGMAERVTERPVLPPVVNAGTGLLEGREGTGGNDAERRDTLETSDFFGRLVSHGIGEVRLDPQSLRIATYDRGDAPSLLARGTGFELGATGNLSAADDWWVAPAGADLVRVQTYDRGHVYAVSAQSGGRVTLMPLTQDPRQLWRVTGAGRLDNRYLLENVHFAGNCLTNMGQGRVVMQPINFAPTQLWVPLVAPPIANFQPFYRTLSQEVHANPQLPPAQVELANSQRYALLLLLGDSRGGKAVQQIRIEPNSSQVVALDRDAGSTIIETVETLSSLGGWERQQFVTTVPPLAFYDVSVYEEHLQSIAIDRTGKSPNPIEDVNYVPKSVGWFPIPAGAALPSSSRLDVYPQALSGNNPGAVRRLDPKQFDSLPPSNRLEDILQELQPTPARRKF